MFISMRYKHGIMPNIIKNSLTVSGENALSIENYIRPVVLTNNTFALDVYSAIIKRI